MHSGPELLGQNVRRLRRTRGLSLVELGRYAGLAKGTLTQIEAGRGNPTIETLQALARALGATLAELVEESADASPRIVRRAEGEPVVAPGVAGRLVHRTHVGSAILELHEWRLAAGAAHRGPQHAPGVTEQVFVLEGAAEVGPVDAPSTLGPRDFVRYAADVPHLYRAVEGRALVLVQVVFPALPSGRSPSLLPDAPVPRPLAPPAPAPPPARDALPQPPVRGRRPTTRGPAARPTPPPAPPRTPGPGR